VGDWGLVTICELHGAKSGVVGGWWVWCGLVAGCGRQLIKHAASLQLSPNCQSFYAFSSLRAPFLYACK
jgi:hypothetical protein